MLKLMIVDDEEIIRSGLLSRLAYLKLSFEEVRQAENGRQALAEMETFLPELVITDIRMADMDGLTFIAEARKRYAKIKFIILSGYAEFAYAEQAIKLGVSAYLLKPISNEGLKHAVLEVMEAIAREEKHRKVLSEGSRMKEDHKRLLFEKDVNALMNRQEPLKEEGILLKDSVNSVFPISEGQLLLSLIHIDMESYQHKQFGHNDIELIRFAIANIFEEIETVCDKIIVNNLSNPSQMYGILVSRQGNAKQMLRGEAEQLFTALQGLLFNRMKIAVSIGISGVRKELSLNALKEAQEAFLKRVVNGRGSISFYEDRNQIRTAGTLVSEMNLLAQYIERNDVSNIEVLLLELLSEKRVKKNGVAYIRVVWVQIIGILLRCNGESTHLVHSLQEIEGMHSLEETYSYLLNLIMDCLADFDITETSAKNKIKMAAKYITEHYTVEIAIHDLAERFFMSPNYFSSQFKKETGISTLQFIKELRVEKAKELLKHTEKSVVEIAKEVGYEDAQYFFKVFKKVTDTTPMQYRSAPVTDR